MELIKLRFDNPKLFALTLIIVVLVGSYFSYAMSNSVVITNDVSISLSVITAKSGSRADIQSAVNTVAAAGGGTVYIPAGNFSWNGETVTVPAEVNIIGASYAGCSGHDSNWTNYKASTILHNTADSANVADMFVVVGNRYHATPSTRISGIQFEATPPTNTTEEATGNSVAILLTDCYNFRVDHCSFVNFHGTSVFADANNGDNSSATCFGVIDHCVVTLPYKLTAPPSGSWYWGYGFYARGINNIITGWTLPITDFYGYYGGRLSYTIMYVEDCHFSLCRHSTDACQGGYVVDRFDLFDERACGYASGMSDIHGSPDGVGVGGRGTECYNNTYVGWTSTPAWEDADTWAIQLRGGAGLFYNNTYTPNGATGEGAAFVYLSMADENTPNTFWNVGMDVNQTYIWNNVYTRTELTVDSPITQNVNYFLRAPNQAQDGFNYTPYPYPHPLTLSS